MKEGLIINGQKFSIKRPFSSEFKRLSGLVLDDKQIREFISILEKQGVKPLTTCFSKADVKKIKNLGFSEIKVASYDCSSYQLIRELIKYFSHLYIFQLEQHTMKKFHI